MPTPAGGYYTRDGKRVPGTTTVLGLLKEPDALMWWSWHTAYVGLERARALLEAAARGDVEWAEVAAFLEIPLTEFDYREKQKAAADAGTCAHAMVEAYVRGKPFNAAAWAPGILEVAQPPYEAFLNWAANNALQPAHPELRLVSERWRYGGTIDAMLVGGELALGDWKTSKGVYWEMLCQLAAYGELWRENNVGHQLVGGYHLLRFSKQEHPDDPVHFAHHHWSQLDLAFQTFRLLREVYDVVPRLRRMV